MLDTPNRYTAPSLHGILFAEDFDDEPMAQAELHNGLLPADKLVPELGIVAPHFSAEDLTTARHEGFAAGRDAGLADAKARHDQRISDACASIAASLERDAAMGAHLIEQSVAAAVRLLIDALAAMLPATCARNQAREVADAVRGLVADMTGETVMRVGVAHAQHNDLRSALMSLPPHLARRVVLCPTDDVADGDATLSWDQGTASFSAGRARHAVMEVLAALQLIQPERDPAPPHLRPPTVCPPIMRKTDTLFAVPIEEGESIDA